DVPVRIPRVHALGAVRELEIDARLEAGGFEDREDDRVADARVHRGFNDDERLWSEMGEDAAARAFEGCEVGRMVVAHRRRDAYDDDLRIADAREIGVGTELGLLQLAG